MKVVIHIEDEQFLTEGFRTISPNWIELYSPYVKYKEVILPPLKKGEKINYKSLNLLHKKTIPPPRFTQATVLREMEKLGLGTKATRAGIMQTLYDRGYIDEKSIVVTKLGEAVINALEKYCQEIVSVDLTKKFEEDMEAIQEGKIKKEEIIEEAKQTLGTIMKTFKENEKKIGEELLVGLKEVLKSESTIGPCKCGGTLIKRKSRAGKRFVGCSSYPKCTETFSLPHEGTLKPLSDTCDCGLFLVSVKRMGKRPWKLCIRCGFKK